MTARARRPKKLTLELLVLGVLGALASLTTLAACGRSAIGESGGPVVVAVVEVSDASPAMTGAIVGAGEERGGGTVGCAFEAEAEDIVPSSATCTIYEQVSGAGRVTMPCGGADGPAFATFGQHEYRGEVRDKRYVLEHEYEFEEGDGCRWRIHGRITGTAGAAKASWTYREEILEDDVSNCWGTCTARTAIRLSPVR